MLNAMLNQIIDFVLSIQFAALILSLIGIYALACWCIDNLKSVVQIIRSFLVPYFQPQEDLPLSEKFGNWAGMKQNELLFELLDILCSYDEMYFFK